LTANRSVEKGRAVMPVIEVTNLRKRYRDQVAVHDVSFTVDQGEIFGILGPNGAGKTTTVESIAGLRRPDGGIISAFGLDPQRDRAALRQRVGVQLQESELPEKMTVREAMELYGSFYPRPADRRRLLDELGLAEKSRTRYGKLSGGQKQRLSVATAAKANVPGSGASPVVPDESDPGAHRRRPSGGPGRPARHVHP
jgi:ABC-2 type transport system ATP-binding protein